MTSLLPDRVRVPSATPYAEPHVEPHVEPDVEPDVAAHVAPSAAQGRSWTPSAAALAAGSLGAALVAVLVAALLVGGGAPAPATAGLPDAGAVVGWGQPVVQLLGRVLAVLVVGSLLVAALLVPAPGGLPTSSRRAVRTAAAAAAGWAACEVAGLVLLTASLLARPVTDLAPADVVAVVPAFPAGRTVLLVLVLLAVVVAGYAARTAWQAGVLLLVALAAVVLPVLTSGHPAAAGDHAATVTALAVHVVAASLWVGGLLGVLLHLGRPAGPTAVLARVVALQRLSRLALLCVVVVTGSGVVGALLVTDRGPADLPDLLTSGYGALLVAKTAAVVLLVAAGWAHRLRTLPALAAGAPRAFLRLAVVETGLMVVTLAVAVGLASSPPPEGTPADAPAAAAVDAPVADAPAAPAAGSPAAAGTAAGETAAGETPAGETPAGETPAGETPAGETAAGEAPAAPAAEDMSGHDHGELSVAVLVDGDRLHVGDPVSAGTPVTVYNTGPAPVVLRADDGTFSAAVPSRTFITFPAPQEPGAYAFGDPDEDRYRDVLTVVPPAG